MADTIRLLTKAAREAVQDIVERYDGYHPDLVGRFVDVLRIQHGEPGDRARRRAIAGLIEVFAGQVADRIGDANET